MNIELVGSVTDTRVKIETALIERKAFDIKSAANIQIENLNLVPALNIMEKSGLIVRTEQGKIYMTQKGHDQSTRGFKVSNNFPEKKFVRFSRNK